jgi:hypothetical protein
VWQPLCMPVAGTNLQSAAVHFSGSAIVATVALSINATPSSQLLARDRKSAKATSQ